MDPANDYETNIGKLLHGRIDGYLVDDVHAMMTYVGRLGVWDRVGRYPMRIAGKSYHLMFSRASVHVDLVSALETALARMTADGRLDAVFDKYFEGHTEEPLDRTRWSAERRLGEP